MPITLSPPPPRPSSPSDFATKADARLAWEDLHVTEMNAALVVVEEGMEVAQQSVVAAAIAEAAAVAAVNASGAIVFNPLTNYAQYACAISPITYLTYRRKTAGANATDPSLDSANWVSLTPVAVNRWAAALAI